MKNQGNFFTPETDLLLKANLPQSVCLPSECAALFFSIQDKSNLYFHIYIYIHTHR